MYLLLALTLLVLTAVLVLSYSRSQQVRRIKTFARNEATLGHMNGTAVRIPGGYGFLMNRESLASSERRQGTLPAAYRRAIFSFGFEKPLAVAFEHTPYMGLDAGVIDKTFGVTVISDRGAANDDLIVNLTDSAAERFGHPYREIEPEFGLEKYIPDPSVRSRHRLSKLHPPDLYVHRDVSGAADILFECMSADFRLASCSMNFLLVPDIKARVSVRFSRQAMPGWASILAYSKEKIRSFVVHPMPSS